MTWSLCELPLPVMFLYKMFPKIQPYFSSFKMRLAANSYAVYLAIIASATETDHANTLGFKALETELGYRQDDLLPNV